jgi:hypothetical protein
MNTTNDSVAVPCKRDNGIRVLTEAEREEVAGGTPSIPIPPPRPGFLELLEIRFG